MNIRVDLKTNIADGSEVVFRSPADCSQVTGLVIYHNGGKTEFAFADAHGENVGDIDHLFAENAVVKVILDVTAGMAFVQNADTNAYIERTFIKSVNGKAPEEGKVELNADDVGALPKDALQEGVNLALKQAKESGAFDGKDGADGKDGKDGRDGKDYTLTDKDKQEIADMIPVPEIPGGGGNANSVKSFGAVGDGVADDTGAIQAALDASKDGGTIIIPKGVYLLSDALRFYSNQHIKGEPGAVLLQKDGNTGGAYGNLMRNYYAGQGGYTATENTIIEGITFDGGSQTATPSTLLAFSHARNILIDRCTFVNGYSDSTVNQNGHDIEVNSSYNVTVSGCTFRNNRRIGYLSELVQVDCATSEFSYPWGPDAFGKERNDDGTISDTVVVEGCLFEGVQRETLTHRNCFVGGHTMESTNRNVIVRNNIMRDSCYAVHFYTVEGLIVQDNQIHNTAVGIYIDTADTGTLVLGNNFTGEVQRGYPTSKVKGYGNVINGEAVEEVTVDLTGYTKEDRVSEMIGDALAGFEPPASGGGGEWRHIRTVTIPEDITTDTSGVIWRDFAGDGSKGYGFEFDADENGEKFDYNDLFIEYESCSQVFGTGTQSGAMFQSWLTGVVFQSTYFSMIPLFAAKPGSTTEGWVQITDIKGSKRHCVLGSYKEGFSTVIPAIYTWREPVKGIKAKGGSIKAICLALSNMTAGFAPGSKFTFYGR